MHKVRAKKTFGDKKAEEAAADTGKKKEVKPALDPLMPLVTEEELAASGSDAPSLQIQAENSEWAKKSIHYPFANGPQMATFFDRMRLTKRSFYYQEQPTDPEVKLVEPDFCDTDEEAVAKAYRDKPGLASKGLLNEEEVKSTNNRQRDQWYRLCTMEYLSRQQQYRKKQSNYAMTLKLVVPCVIGLVLLLATCWPLWDNLLDIETSNHYATLGLPSTASISEIKKAYRTMTKQWHPDLNPDCGQKCRDMTMKIQEAYDKLISRGSGAAEDLEQQKETQIKEALNQIRNLIFFKAYSIAFYCAEYINLLVLSLPFVRGASWKGKAENMVRILVVVAFSAVEVFFVTGFNLIIIFQIFYFAVNMVTGSASKKQMEKWLKRSNFDFIKDLCVFIIPSLLFHGGYFFFFEQYPKYDAFVLESALGFAYLASHLAKYTPNLFDNWTLKKCSLTTQYMKPVLSKSGRMTLQYTAWNFWSSEFSIILDDLFAFTSSIPSVFRLAVIGIHVCYLVQLRLLPWDAPITGKLGQRYRKQQDKRAAIASSPLDDDSDEEDMSAGDFAERLRSQSGDVPLWRAKKKLKGTRPLSDTEREWFSNVDGTGILWMDIPYTKYGHSLAKHSTPQTPNTSTQLCMTPDLQEVLVTHVNKNKVIPPQLKDAALLDIANNQSSSPQFKVCERFKDPDMCRLLYRDMKATIFLQIANSAATTAANSPPDVRSKDDNNPMSIVYRRCGGAFGHQHSDNNVVRQCSILTGGVSVPGIRSKEPVVSFALKPDSVDYVDTDPKGRRPYKVMTTISLINIICIVASLAAVYALYLIPEPEASLRNPDGGANRQARSAAAASTAFEPFLTPVCAQKYTNLLPGEHLLNGFAAGAIVVPPITSYDQKLPIPIFVPDMWDALRQLSLFTTAGGGGGFEDTSSQQQQKPKKSKKSKKE